MENKQVYRLQGLSCTDCARKFTENVKAIPTVEEASLNYGAAKLTVTGEATIEQLEKAGAFEGIKVYPEREKTFERISLWKKRENMLALIALLFIAAGYAATFLYGAKSTPAITLFILAIVIGGFDLFRSGIKNLIRLKFDIETLMTIAIIGAAIIGEWTEGAVVVFLFAVSEALESYSVDKARDSIRSLMKIAPSKTVIRRGSELLELDVDDVAIGDVMVIKPGQKIALDGEVLTGETSINEAAITGESIPVHKTAGDEVFAGTLNEEGYIEVTVTKLASDTTIAKIIHLVEEAQEERAPAQKFVDRFAKYYTPAIILIALFTAVIPPLFFGAAWHDWIYSGLAVLVVGCPCALVISTPVAIVTAIGNAAKKGVLIKGGVHLEETGHLRAIAFDKTGTLTEGRPEVTDVKPLLDMKKLELLGIAAAIEQFSQHPLASAIIRKAEIEQAPQFKAEAFQSITGKGAKAEIDGKLYLIGNAALFAEKASLDRQAQETIASLRSEGKTVMLLGTESSLLGLIAVADQLRDSSRSVIQGLHRLGIEKTVMLTGDNFTTGKAIASQLGIAEVHADLLPENKLELIKKLKQDYGSIAMVGDGINDAPALATASVGIAMGGAGSDTALETADIALMADDLEKLPFAVSLSRKTLNVIKQNVSFALSLKLIALLLVIPGWLTLWLAIFADLGATLLVVLNSMRLIKTKAIQ